MAKPVRGGLRPAPRQGGLTSPDLVTAPPRPSATRQHATAIPARFPDKPQNSQRRDAHARENCKITMLEAHLPEMITQSCAVD